MATFTIIIFGLAVIRTVHPLMEPENWTAPKLIVAVSMLVAYVWFLNQFVLV